MVVSICTTKIQCGGQKERLPGPERCQNFDSLVPGPSLRGYSPEKKQQSHDAFPQQALPKTELAQPEANKPGYLMTRIPSTGETNDCHDHKKNSHSCR